jgi:hypothetical protein
LGNLFSGTPASNWRELRLHLNVMPTGTGVFKFFISKLNTATDVSSILIPIEGDLFTGFGGMGGADCTFRLSVLLGNGGFAAIFQLFIIL